MTRNYRFYLEFHNKKTILEKGNLLEKGTQMPDRSMLR